MTALRFQTRGRHQTSRPPFGGVTLNIKFQLHSRIHKPFTPPHRSNLRVQMKNTEKNLQQSTLEWRKCAVPGGSVLYLSVGPTANWGFPCRGLSHAAHHDLYQTGFLPIVQCCTHTCNIVNTSHSLQTYTYMYTRTPTHKHIITH